MSWRIQLSQIVMQIMYTDPVKFSHILKLHVEIPGYARWLS